MNNDKIHVTVDGEPVTTEVSWDDVRAYLRAKGWTEGAETTIDDMGECLGGSVSVWTIDDAHALVWSTGTEFQSRYRIQIAVQNVARREKRHPSAVLRDIARGASMTAVALNQQQAEVLVDVILGKKVGWSHEQVAALAAHLLLNRPPDEHPEVLALVDGAKRRVIREAEHLKRYEEAGEVMVARDESSE